MDYDPNEDMGKFWEENKEFFKDFSDIVDAKWEYLAEKIESLILIKDAVEGLRYTEKHNYASLREKLKAEAFGDKQDLIDYMEQFWIGIDREIKHYPNIGKDILNKFNTDYYNITMEFLLDINYTPPSDREELIVHGIILLCALNTVHVKIDLSEMTLELSMLKITGAAQSIITEWEIKAKRDSQRMGRNIIKRRIKSDEKKKYILEIYKQSPTIKIGMNLSEVARECEDIFKARKRNKELPEKQRISKDIDQPGLEQIKRYLKTDVLGDFEKVKREWVKHV